jgi:hypothetical protein
MNERAAEWVLLIMAGLTALIWLVAILSSVMKLVGGKGREKHPDAGSSGSSAKTRRFRKTLLPIIAGSFVVALFALLFGFIHGGLDDDTGRIFLFSGSLIFLSSLYLAAIFLLAPMMVRNNRR